MEEKKYYIRDVESGMDVEVSKEEFDRYEFAMMELRKEVSPGGMGKVMMIGTGGHSKGRDIFMNIDSVPKAELLDPSSPSSYFIRDWLYWGNMEIYSAEKVLELMNEIPKQRRVTIITKEPGLRLFEKALMLQGMKVPLFGSVKYKDAVRMVQRLKKLKK